ncbi:MAG: hypothetical protein JWQ71_1154 [Pedosphaera sp.]|nr:hypothetical protein [Pedosphaera sp.]
MKVRKEMLLARNWLVAGVIICLMAISANAADQPPKIDPRADELLKRFSDYLADAKFFSVTAEIWQDTTLPSGQQVQAGRSVDIQLRRPNRLHTEVKSTRHSRGLWYDGKNFTLLDRAQNLYGTTRAPGSLDETLDFATDHLGMVLPLEDLLVSNPYKEATKKVTAGTYIGPVKVLGVPCQHLAFTQSDIDWQIWIEDGPMPVPRKLVITYKDEAGTPQFTAVLSKWDFATKLPDFVFHFEPPDGASKIPVQDVQSGLHKEKKP